MGSKILYTQVKTSASLEQVVDNLAQCLLPLGGAIAKSSNTVQLEGGKEGVQFGFTADFSSQAVVQQTDNNTFNITMNVQWKMSTLTIICLIVGIFVFGILWIVPLLFLFVDPSTVYNNYLLMLQSKLPPPN